jgi:hypothetical protein
VLCLADAGVGDPVGLGVEFAQPPCGGGFAASPSLRARVNRPQAAETRRYAAFCRADSSVIRVVRTTLSAAVTTAISPNLVSSAEAIARRCSRSGCSATPVSFLSAEFLSGLRSAWNDVIR